jgi:hypothetical protein
VFPGCGVVVARSGPGFPLALGVVGRGGRVQVSQGACRGRVNAVARAWAQSQSWSMCRWRVRPVRVGRAATCMAWQRKVAGSQRRRLPSKQSACDQVSRSPAVRTSLSQTPIFGERLPREVTWAGCFRAADPVLDAGVGAVADFEGGELPGLGVGEERGEPVPFGVGEPELRAGVGRSRRTMTRHRSDQTLRSSMPVIAATCAVAGLTVDVVGRGPPRVGDGEDGGLGVIVDREPQRQRASRYGSCDTDLFTLHH